ncbi:Lateral organ boundaries, LOB [Dillenia turbinata]|uniref:Lateral organ boundaries, LOB n=1 Tax=Dillenia turbinata TaxID=194707 RepID=A0AAN8V1G6_9MAGN
MSCNGCRVLRKGCSETCILRPCLQWIETPEAQGHATVFVAKFFGRAGLMSFISAVPENQRPALFQSLLFEACGRTVNPVNGAVGLLWMGNWHVCQAAVETVLRGGTLRSSPELLTGGSGDSDEAASEAEVCCADMRRLKDPMKPKPTTTLKRKKIEDSSSKVPEATDLDLRLNHYVSTTPTASNPRPIQSRRAATPSLNSEESATTTMTSFFDGGFTDQSHFQQQTEQQQFQPKLLNLFTT